MMKPRNENVRCEKQAVGLVPVRSMAESWLLAISHPGLSGAEFIAGFEREQVNLSVLGKMETANPCIGLMQADRGRPGRSSEEISVMEMEPRAWLVGVLNRRQLEEILG